MSKNKNQDRDSMRCFVNFSNHPSGKWDNAQREAALEYGEIIDVPFPSVDPDLGERDIDSLSDKYVREITEYDPVAVMCQGEFTLCFSVTQKLQALGIKVLSACSKRDVIEKDGKRISVFRFVKFREY